MNPLSVTPNDVLKIFSNKCFLTRGECYWMFPFLHRASQRSTTTTDHLPEENIIINNHINGAWSDQHYSETDYIETSIITDYSKRSRPIENSLYSNTIKATIFHSHPYSQRTDHLQ